MELSKKINKKVMDKLIILNNSKDNELNNLFSIIDKNIDKMSTKQLCNLRLFFLKHTDIRFNCNKENEVALDTVLSKADDRIKIANPTLQSNINKTSSKLMDRISKITNSKITKTIMMTAFTIVICFIMNAIPCFAAESSKKKTVEEQVQQGYKIVRMLASVVCFVFMCVELSQVVVRGDTRAIWYIVTKYVLIIIAICSYRKIFQLIDGFFN